MDNDDRLIVGRVALTLLILRLTLGLFLLQWGAEKLAHPEMSAAIFDHFYGLQPAVMPIYAAGLVEILVALAVMAGFGQPVSYWLALAIHAATVIVSWRQLSHPWMSQGSHLFIASVPVLGALAALVLLRRWDAFSVDHKLGWLTDDAKALPHGSSLSR
jgi:putative oxidoreductase